MDDILTVQEVAAYLKVSRSTVWRWCSQGKLLAFKAGHGWRVPRWSVEQLMGQGPPELKGGAALTAGNGEKP